MVKYSLWAKSVGLVHAKKHLVPAIFECIQTVYAALRAGSFYKQVSQPFPILSSYLPLPNSLLLANERTFGRDISEPPIGGWGGGVEV